MHIESFHARVANLEKEVQELRADVKELLAIMNAGKGAWRTLAVVGGAVIAISGLAITVWKLLKP